jgi:hypothetical protein
MSGTSSKSSLAEELPKGNIIDGEIHEKSI